MGTDGLFDNLYDEDIKKCLRVNPSSIERQADCIATSAEFMSYKKNYESPFWSNAVKEYQKDSVRYLGGKQDDITVIVAEV